MASKKRRAAKPAKTKDPLQVKKDLLADLSQHVAAATEFAVVDFDSDDVIGHVKGVTSSGSLAIDTGTGILGMPQGRLVEVYGAPQCGKTTLCGQILAATQRIGGVGVICDVEEKLDLPYFVKLGVNKSELKLLQPATLGKFKTFESVLLSIEASLDYWIEHKVQLPLTIVWDSVAATPTSTEMEDLESKQPGVPAKLLRKAMRRLTQKIAQARALVVVVNQQYEKIGMTRVPGVRRSTYGGGGIRYHATMRLELIRTGWLNMSNGESCGLEGIAKFIKNNVAVPLNIEYAILWGGGFSDYWTLYTKLKEFKYITSGGGWYTFSVQGSEPRKFQRSFVGLGEMCANDVELYRQILSIYHGLTAPPQNLIAPAQPQ